MLNEKPNDMTTLKIAVRTQNAPDTGERTLGFATMRPGMCESYARGVDRVGDMDELCERRKTDSETQRASDRVPEECYLIYLIYVIE